MKFTLGPRDWEVKEVTDAWFKANIDKSTNHGWCEEESNTIYIIKPKVDKRTEEFRDIVIKHEILHAMMYTLGYVDHDELLVDGLANMWVQYEKTNGQK